MALDMLKKNPFVRSPTLDTVLMIEKIIEEHSGEFNRTELWKRLPKKVMWQTYLVVLDYLQSINKIAIDNKGDIAYIWSPEAGKRFSKRKEIKNKLLFVGNFLYVPNVEAIKLFINQVVPLLDDKTTLTIIGKNASKVVSNTAQIITKEFVDDITKEYRNADALVFPLRIGGGTNFKVLEAMALGLPVIAFPDRLTSLTAKPGKDFIHVVNIKEFANEIKKITDDRMYARNISENARKLVEDYYSWDSIGKKLSRVWKEWYERKN